MADIIAQLIERADAHREAGEYISGTYGDIGNWNGACAIGCTICDLVQMGKLPADTDPGDHAAISEVTGIPKQLLHLEDAIFEGVPAEDRPAWPGRFLRAAHGRDLTMAWPRFALWLLSDETSPMRGRAQDGRVRDAVAGVAAIYRQWVDTGTRPPENARAAAGDAAWAAAGDAAWDAAGDAAWDAAWAAAWAAASDAAGDAAGAAAWDAAWRTMADKLTEIMEAPQ